MLFRGIALSVLVVLVGCGSDSSVSIDAADLDSASPDATSIDAAPRMYTGLFDAYIKASNTQAYDSFGRSLAISADGNTLAVGASMEASNANTINGDQADNSAWSSGAVYVYTRVAGTWVQQAYVKANNAGGGDSFGTAVALSADGSTLAVGAEGEASASAANPGDNTRANAGAAYVFVRAGGAWSQQAYLKSSNPDADDAFGSSLSLSSDGDLLAVSAPSEDSNAVSVGGDPANNLRPASGAVFVFSRNGTAWAPQAYIKATNPDALDAFGHEVALAGDGNTLAVSAPYEASGAVGVGGDQTSNAEADAGAVYTYTRTGATWSPEAYLKASNSDAGDLFGSDLALSSDGDTLAVSAHEDSAADGIGGDQADNSAKNAGAVYVFRRASSWTQEAYVKASNSDPEDSFTRVALSPDGTLLVVGAFRESSAANGIDGDQTSNSGLESGAAYVFQRAGTWTQRSYLKAQTTSDQGDWFGSYVAVSNEGTIAVAAQLEASAAVGVGGDQTSNAAPSSGAVYVYH